MGMPLLHRSRRRVNELCNWPIDRYRIASRNAAGERARPRSSVGGLAHGCVRVRARASAAAGARVQSGFEGLEVVGPTEEVAHVLGRGSGSPGGQHLLGDLERLRLYWFELPAEVGALRLERFGGIVLQRPSPQSLWKPREPEAKWRSADASYRRSSQGGGKWDALETLP